jgi:hypothetical protein
MPAVIDLRRLLASERGLALRFPDPAVSGMQSGAGGWRGVGYRSVYGT